MTTQKTNTNRRLIGFLLVLLAFGLVGLTSMALLQGTPGQDEQPSPDARLIATPSATLPRQASGAPTVAAPATRQATLPSPTVQATVAAIATATPVEQALAETAGSIATPEPLLPEPTIPVAPTTPPIVPPTGAGETEALQPLREPQAPPPPTATKVKPTPKPQPAVHILPNGVRYGDRKPDLPNRITRITSPNIRLDTPVYEVYSPKGSWEVADYAGGHHYNSVNPGDGGNIVVAGHNNWRGEVFRYLENLAPGNEIIVTTLDGKEHKYRVEEVLKLKEAGATRAQRLENAKVMGPTPHEQLTLITCWPYTTYTHRLIVIAKRVE